MEERLCILYLFELKTILLENAPSRITNTSVRSFQMGTDRNKIKPGATKGLKLERVASGLDTSGNIVQWHVAPRQALYLHRRRRPPKFKVSNNHREDRLVTSLVVMSITQLMMI